MKSILDILKNDLEQALGFLKKKYPQSFFSMLFKKKKIPPCYMLIGASGVGKSSLLLESGLEFVDVHGERVEQVYPTQHCQWLFSDQATFLDMTGRYEAGIWFEWFKLLKCTQKAPLQGILIAFDLKYSQPASKQIEIIINVLKALSENIQGIPIYIVFTQCDHIAGFAEFFEDLGLEEKREIFGLHFSGVRMQQDFLHQFEEKFDTLLERLNQRVIWRIHQEHQVEKRFLIKCLPIQIASLKSNCRELLKRISQTLRVDLKGVYFTSVRQEGRAVDYLGQGDKNYFSLGSHGHFKKELADTQFFTAGIFSEILKRKSNVHLGEKIGRGVRYFAWISSSFILAIGLMVGYMSYQKNTALLQEMESFFSPSSAKGILVTLDKLNVARNEIKEKTGNGSFLLYEKPVNELYQAVDSTYEKLLNTVFLRQARDMVEHQLRLSEDKPEMLYSALKVYLMLNNVDRRDDAFIRDWFKFYWGSKHIGSKEKEASFLQYLSQILGRHKRISINQSLVEKSRKTLHSISKTALVFSILKSFHLENNAPDFSEDASFFDISVSPFAFKEKNVKEIYYETLPYICKKLTKGNWVLQDIPPIASGAADLDDFVQHVQLDYLKRYHVFWSSHLVFDIERFDSIGKMANLAKKLVAFNLDAFLKNTAPISGFPEFNQIVAQDFMEIHLAIEKLGQSSVKEVFGNLNAYFSVIMDSNAGAFIAAKMRMVDDGKKDPIMQLHRLADRLPAPFSIWFEQIANTSWKLILKQARVHLNKKWVSTVLPFYRGHVDKHYPVFEKSNKEMSLDDLKHFFGEKGVFTQFFDQNIRYFVNQRNFYWEWKKIDGEDLGISQSTLEVFIRGSLVNKMFFSKGKQMPAFTFSFIPTQLGEGVQDFIFQFNDQYMNYRGNADKAKVFLWPGTVPYLVSMKIIGKSGKILDHTEKGVWGLFRLLDHAHLENALNSNYLNVTFSLGRQTVQGRIVVDSEVNPLMHGILNAFRCPSRL